MTGDGEVPLTSGGLPVCLLSYYVNRFGTLGALFDIKADAVALGKALEAAALNRRMVDKNISIVFGGDEAKTLAVVEPLHSSL